MLGPHRLIVDEWAEVLSQAEMWNMLEPYADISYWQWPQNFDPQAFYIVGRNVFAENRNSIVDLARSYPGRILFSNPAEGSSTVLAQLDRLGIYDLVKQGHIGLLASGDLGSEWNYCSTDFYFTSIVSREENRQAYLQAHYGQSRPFDFLFLNGRLRPHRKYLIDSLRDRGLLERALWSNLDTKVSRQNVENELPVTGNESLRLLPSCYEIPQALEQLNQLPDSGFIKPQLFNNSWGDAIVNARCYTDTWFSVVTETVFDYPYSFRTEKIWKPILMEHPFIVAANVGYYRDLKLAGFQTFDNVIDESFDEIEDSATRLDCITEEIQKICALGPAVLWERTQEARKYNRQRLIEHDRILRWQFPHNLKRYLDERSGI